MESYKEKWDHVLNWVICQLTDCNLTDDQKNAYGRVLAVMAAKEQGKVIYSGVGDGSISGSSLG